MDASVFIAVADGVSPASAQQAITAPLAEFPTAELRDQRAAIAGGLLAGLLPARRAARLQVLDAVSAR